MKLIAQVKLQPNNEQYKALKQTLESANTACDTISKIAWDSQTFGQFALHKLAYNEMRASTNLSAQMVVRCIAKVANAYKLDKKRQIKFKPLGAISYDDRILSYYSDKQIVSIWTINGREKINYQCGEHQRRLLATRQGESDLVYYQGSFYLLAVCNVVEPAPTEIESALGGDMGILNILTDSTGECFSAEQVEKVRQRYHKLRQTLQAVGTKSAKRHLKKLSKQEANFRKNENHVISKHFVLKAKAQKSVIGLEDLKGIRDRTTVRKADRAKHSGWAFYQLRQFTQYKAKKYGVPAIEVDPRNSSRECSRCHHISKANRKSQSQFCCIQCGHSENADINAAKNIAQRALKIYRASVNAPIAVCPKKLPIRATGTASLAING